MTFEQIIQLSQAGFSAEQIAALAPLMTSPAQPAAVNAPVEQPKIEQPATVPAPVEQPQIAQPGNVGFADVMAQLTKLTNAITTSAIINSQQPAVRNESAEDALASIVIPTI